MIYLFLIKVDGQRNLFKKISFQLQNLRMKQPKIQQDDGVVGVGEVAKHSFGQQ